MSTTLNGVSVPISCSLGRKGSTFSEHLSREFFNVNPCHTVIHGDFQLFALVGIILQ